MDHASLASSAHHSPGLNSVLVTTLHLVMTFAFLGPATLCSAYVGPMALLPPGTTRQAEEQPKKA
jgi:hypothetical protein